MWRMNTRLLQSPKYSPLICRELEPFFLTNNDSVSDTSILWASHKAFMRGIFIQLGARDRRRRRQRVDELLKDIQSTDTLNKQQPHPDHKSKLIKLRLELRLLLLEKFDIIQKRCKMHFYSSGNKAGKLLAQQIKGQRVKAHIPFIYHPTTNEKLRNPQDMADAFSAYYSTLYNIKNEPSLTQPNHTAIQAFLDSIQLPHLTDRQIETLNIPFTISEVDKAIDSLRKNKSLGPDGFVGEYYQQFKSILNEYLVRMFNDAASSASFPQDMLKALIVMLPKPGKDPNTPQNFRPISLLNHDIKLYAKIIANRLIDLLPTLIHPDQSGFTKGRQTSDATQRMVNIIHHAEKHEMPSLLLSLDAEKAFNRVHWHYLDMGLQKFGFQGHILSAIMALYSHPSAQVYCSSMLSKPFDISNGTRQGCPLSPLLFIIVMEPLAEQIRTQSTISGFKIGTTEHKINLFADDIILLLTNPATSLASVQNTLSDFSEVSYYKVNDSKSFILPLGIPTAHQLELETQYPYTWAKESISYLGLKRTRKTSYLYRANFTPFLNNLPKELEQFPKFALSWSGRLAAFKMLKLPQLLYLFRSLPIPIPGSFFTSLQKILRHYIWQKKRARCSRATLIKPKLVGGAGLIHFRDYYNAALLAQIKAWFTPTFTSPWLDIEAYQVPGRTLSVWLLSSLHRTIRKINFSPTIVASRLAFKYLLNNAFKGTSPYRIPLSISVFSILIPILSTQTWQDKVIGFVSDIYSNNLLRPFTSLKDSFHLTPLDYYKYTQITHCLLRTPQLHTDVHPLVWTYLSSLTANTKGISLFYNMLEDKTSFSKSPPLLKWERDLGCSFTESQWRTALKTNYKASRSSKLWELVHKINLRWYITPSMIHTYDPTTQPLCWRNCGEIGSLFHLLWQCTHTTALWQEVFQIITEVTGLSLFPSPDLALLNINMENISYCFHTIITHILLAARLTIVCHWRT